ncbi:helix-turn-helix domain-containing protein [Sphingobacterium paramultivorum]|uniref:Helix-turn-helix domain-containing protein n=1 Tax=Sphingobacterium paramultivorum TaxID=2886510 RepID=A0A7G5E0X7_9SPHI|nr:MULTISPECIES: helix-turn-helix domain-containing protein [Sphingobacterium]MCS4165059.1 transcriptional regulator GlxA family with amidase domain [Sphingobacterium sp. BIGb0116]QMV67652.1 helix-turn-helix domain-containing protein [Sphingobacterium paramultivorum]WSO16533.1 helix-turn-helix domain-containing protein [Sphingobacterium paramultivorum]
MKHLTILVPDSQTGPNTISCIVGTYHVFTEANRYYDKLNREPIFNIELAGVSKQSNFVNGLLTVMTQKDITTIQKTDLIIVPAVISNFSAIEAGNSMLSAWILDHYTKGANVASMCTGAYLLASTGLLDNKNCSIHWKSAANFHKLFPKVNLKTEQIITDEQGIYTNGGGYSFLNLLLYLVEKFYDRQTAIYCSKIFQIDIARQTQSDFMIFNGQKSHGDEMVMRAQDYLENNFSEKISMEKLSEKFTVGRRNFDRRFIKATGNTPVEYLQRIKVESAKKELESSRKTVNEVMYAIGYTDIKAFREIFRRFTGLSPLEYKNKYNKAVIK